MADAPRIHHVDFYPDEWLAGTHELADDEIGVYIRLCALIYSRGGPVTKALLRGVCRSHGHAFNRIIFRLTELGKITINDSQMSVKRCENELQKARKRAANALENGRKGGRPLSKNNDLGKATGYFPEKLELKTNYQLPTTKESESYARIARTHTREGGRFSDLLPLDHQPPENANGHGLADFEKWWAQYPNKVGKAAARKAFAKAKAKAPLDALSSGIERYKTSKPQFAEWCNPATWLNQERWLDSPAPAVNGVAEPEPERRRPTKPPPESL